MNVYHSVSESMASSSDPAQLVSHEGYDVPEENEFTDVNERTPSSLLWVCWDREQKYNPKNKFVSGFPINILKLGR